MIKATILLLLTLNTIYAKSYFLKSSECDWLLDQAANISAWSGKEAELDCSCIENSCRIDVFNLLPKPVQKVVDGYNAYGPNCWNAALVGANILPNFIYTTPQEIKFWLESPLCRLLDSSEQPLPGDVIEVRTMKSDTRNNFGPPGYWPEYEADKVYTMEEVHGMIYLDDDFVFTKNGAAAGQGRYKLMSMRDAYQRYGVNLNCHHLGYIPGDENDINCGSLTWSNIFRCQSANDYFSDYRFIKDQERVYKQLLRLENEIVEVLFVSKDTTVTHAQLSAWKKRANEIKVMVPSDLKASSKKTLFWEILAVHAQSVLRQIHNLEVSGKK